MCRAAVKHSSNFFDDPDWEVFKVKMLNMVFIVSSSKLSFSCSIERLKTRSHKPRANANAASLINRSLVKYSQRETVKAAVKFPFRCFIRLV